MPGTFKGNSLIVFRLEDIAKWYFYKLDYLDDTEANQATRSQAKHLQPATDNIKITFTRQIVPLKDYNSSKCHIAKTGWCVGSDWDTENGATRCVDAKSKGVNTLERIQQARARILLPFHIPIEIGFINFLFIID